MEKITQSQSEMHDKIDRDAFDTLSEKEPEKFLKLQNERQKLITGYRLGRRGRLSIRTERQQI